MVMPLTEMRKTGKINRYGGKKKKELYVEHCHGLNVCALPHPLNLCSET